MQALPHDFVQALADTIDQSAQHTIERRIARHEATAHVPPRRTDPLQAVPFPERTISDVVLAKLVERMEEEGITAVEAALQTGIPLSLLERELADYRSRFRKFLLVRATS